MNVRLARIALGSLRNNKTTNQFVRRVATRWLVANMKLEYDRMMRLQYLEGVARHPQPGLWWKAGVRGLQAALRYFEGQAVQSSWFDPGNSGMFSIIEKTLRTVIGRYPAIHGTDPLDVINAALMGIPMDASEERERVLPAFEAGKYLRDKTLKGEEVPEGVAKGLLNKFMVRRVLDFVKAKKHETGLATDDEGAVRDIPDAEKSRVPAWEVMSALLFRDRDPLAKKLQALMRDTWKQSKPMTHWLDVVLATGSFPDMNEIADLFGIAKSSFGQRHWQPGWQKFIQAMWGDPGLRRDITTRMISEGVDVDDIPEALSTLVRRSDRPHKVASRSPILVALSFYPSYIFRSS